MVKHSSSVGVKQRMVARDQQNLGNTKGLQNSTANNKTNRTPHEQLNMNKEFRAKSICWLPSSRTFQQQTKGFPRRPHHSILLSLIRLNNTSIAETFGLAQPATCSKRAPPITSSLGCLCLTLVLLETLQ